MGIEDEYGGGTRKTKKTGLKPFLPILGLVLAICMGAIAFILGPKASEFASKQFNFENSTTMQWIFRAALFVALLAIAAIPVAASRPKPKSQGVDIRKAASERNLAKEREQRRKEHVANKKRQREINRRMAEENKNKARR